MNAGDELHGPNGEWGIVFKMLDGSLRVAWAHGVVTPVPEIEDQ